MAFNWDVSLNHARSVLRGEVAGSVRFMALLIAGLAVWAGVSWTSGLFYDASTVLTAQEGRHRSLLALVSEYRLLSPASKGKAVEAVDVQTVFAQVAERMALGSRVNRMTPDGKNYSIEVNRLYAEELTELIRELAARGVQFISAEVRALPAGSERLLTLSAVVGLSRK